MEIGENNSDQPISLTTISKRQKISLSYLEQIFSRLKKAGIVKSSKGPGGGYILAKNREEITIAEIIKAIGEPIKMTRCNNAKSGCINNKIKCKTHHLWSGLENKIFDYLNSVSLQSLCK
jgi:Rrf2 family iron-sulfur cluster assembly transcriptional regulator